MKTEEVIRLNMAIKSFQDNANPHAPLPVKFAYAKQLNLRRTEPVFDSYRDVADPMKVQVIADYETRRKAILIEMSMKDANGEPVINGAEYLVPDKVALAAAIDELKAEFPTLEDEVKSFQERVNGLNDEDVEINIHMVSINDCPTEISTSVMEGLMFMIKDE